MKKTAVLILLSLLTAILLIMLARWGITTYNNRQINGNLTSDLPPQTATSGEFALTWNGETFSGNQTITVSAPLGEPGVFYVAGSPIAAEFLENLAEND